MRERNRAIRYKSSPEARAPRVLQAPGFPLLSLARAPRLDGMRGFFYRASFMPIAAKKSVRLDI